MKTKHYGWFLEKYSAKLSLCVVILTILAMVWGTYKQNEEYNRGCSCENVMREEDCNEN